MFHLLMLVVGTILLLLNNEYEFANGWCLAFALSLTTMILGCILN